MSGVEVLERDDSDEPVIPFMPSLFVWKCDLPENVSFNEILFTVGNLYGTRFFGFDRKLYMHLVCPSVSIAIKLRSDGIKLRDHIPNIRVYILPP